MSFQKKGHRERKIEKYRENQKEREKERNKELNYCPRQHLFTILKKYKTIMHLLVPTATP
jgi:hypothetical protein